MPEPSPKRPKILPLPQDVAAQISSSTAIPTLTSVVIGLLENALDAEARNVDIAVDLRRATCTVEDDGHGVEANEFAEEGGLGKRFYTSKYHSQVDHYGGQGTFLSSVASLSILSITSRQRNRVSHSSLVLHHSRPAARFLKAPSHHTLSTYGHGTRVAVQDLFGNMPVRVKQRHSGQFVAAHYGREFDILKKAVTALLLSFHQPVRVFLHHAAGENGILEKHLHIGVTSENLSGPAESKISYSVQNPLLCKILTHAGYIQPSAWDTWVKASARTVNITIRGAFSLQPAPNKSAQFISLGIRPLDPESGHNTLYEETNKLFAQSSFGAQEETLDTDGEKRSKDRRFKQDGYTNRQLRGRGKGVDRWPMFYIRIDLGDQNDTKRLEREATLNNVVKVLGAMVHQFLKDHHFRPHNVAKVTRSSPASSKKLSNLKRVLSSEDAFSDWSRIKSSHRTGSSSLAENTSKEVSKETVAEETASKESTTKEDISKATNEQIDLRPDSESVSPSEEPKPVLVNSVGEELIEWTNPVSKATVFINSRTGLVSSGPASDGRPSTAPAESQNRLGAVRVPRPTSKGFQPPQEGSWAADFLSKWDNPVFAPPTEEPIPQVNQTFHNPDTLNSHHESCSSTTHPSAFRLSTSTISTRLSKADLLSSRVIAQVDKKFILISITNANASNLLFLIDQHAADERIRVEALVHDFRTQDPISAPKPLTFEIPANEVELFERYRRHFDSWGFNYTISLPRSKAIDLATTPAIPPTATTTTQPRLTVQTLPPTLSHRLSTSPSTLISLLRTLLHSLHSSPPPLLSNPPTPNLSQLNSPQPNPPPPNSNSSQPKPSPNAIIPQPITSLLASRACRSAIMFNDVLSLRECQVLVGRLAGTGQPWCCAHGRPSLVGVVEVGEGGEGGEEGGRGGGRGVGLFEGEVREGKEEEGGFGRAWTRWRSGGVVADQQRVGER